MKSNWSIQDSFDLYLISRWGSPYFTINNKGNLSCTPLGPNKGSIDLKALVDDLCQRGIEPPLLVRFNDILGTRVQMISESFTRSIQEYGYKGDYQSVMPIKVNQQRHVVEELLRQGEPYQLGLEAGSKPELLVAMALLKPDSVLVCNGYKDNEYIETALGAQLLGIRPYLVLDRFEELRQIISLSKRLGLRPYIGARAKLSSKGKGRWEESSGDRSKFGLSARELVRVVEILAQEDMLDCLKLLHFHIGSQITSIRAVKSAIREAAHVYCNLRRMGCRELAMIDIGGGLAIDYDGSRTDFHSSMNYSLQEYANDIIGVTMDICDSQEEPHPTIISESGRALVAHHAALIFNVLGINETQAASLDTLSAPTEDDHMILHTMWEAYQAVSKKNLQEAYNDAAAAKEESVTLFSHAVIDLQTKAAVDDLFWAICKKIGGLLKNEAYVPEELQGLSKRLSSTYYCNFSVFQSLPDAWAVGQLFPISPLHRLNEMPTEEAVLADLTCDSDGKLDQFIDLRDVKNTLRLHASNGKPYYLGAFLVGAYQEILGDLHNLFGDTNAVHVSVGPDGNYHLEHLVKGDTVAEVLSYVEYDQLELLRRVRNATESALRQGRISLEQSARIMRFYEDGLAGYTYLEDID